ncbi:hypothetical protein SAMN05216456_1898 [Devosia crocina]|uniref:Uncharacterized protein n=1 Tax=Devosia crocina TaxID=429728 RepID=A0A1I7NER8_9HYPH|nr:hypothetical protein [Devosia crocina]SFV33139.1 hypothetical protein SAMN05216456_1898 [Devosia crocina]
MFFTIYEPSMGPKTGPIVAAYESEEGHDVEAVLKPGQVVLRGVQSDPSLHSVRYGKVTDRPKVAEDRYEVPADGNSEVSFDLPQGTEIWHEGEQLTGEGPFVFRVAVPGTYGFAILPPFPYRQQFVEIVAHAV